MLRGIAQSRSSGLSASEWDFRSMWSSGGLLADFVPMPSYQKAIAAPWIARSADLRARTAVFDHSVAALHNWFRSTTAPSSWEQRGGEAVAIARSAMCHVPNVPPAPPPAALTNPSKHASSGGSENKEDDSLYNAMLDKEYYHDAQGNNYGVSPSEDWHKTGPDGEGYYSNPYGNTVEKLHPGYVYPQ